MTRNDESASRFAAVLASGMAGPVGAALRRREGLLRGAFGYVIGDGTPVCLRDVVTLPAGIGAASRRGTVVLLDDEGLGLRLDGAVRGLGRQFFDWTELRGATVLGMRRGRQRLSVVPPPP